MRIATALVLTFIAAVPAAADWAGDPYSGRQNYHLSGRPSQGADVRTSGREVPVAPQGECWLVRTASPATTRLPAGARSQFIPFNTRAEFDSYRVNNAQGRSAAQCAFNMPVTLCGATVGQTGHRALGTVVGPFVYEDGETTASVTLRADRQGNNSEYGWSVASVTGTCEPAGPGCSDSDYAAAHPDQCGIPVDPGQCSDPDWRASHPAQCGVADPHCPAGYSTHVLLGLIPTYYDESGGDGHANPHTTVGCARTSPSPALATPLSCRPSTFQSAALLHANPSPYTGLSGIGFCGYGGSLDSIDWNNQWGGFPTFCAHALSTGTTCVGDG